MKLKITAGFIVLFSVFSGKYDNDSGDKRGILGDILNMLKPKEIQDHDDDCQKTNSIKKSDQFDSKNKEKKYKDKYNIHRMLKNTNYIYAMQYKALKIEMMQAETQDFKIKNNEEYRKRKASLRMHLLKINVISANYTNSVEQQPDLNTYEAADQFNSKSMRRNYWSALKYQQYLISLKHAYDQHIANLTNAQHMRMLESNLMWMQSNSAKFHQLNCQN